MGVGTNMRDDLYDGIPYWKVDDKPPWLQIHRTLAQQESAPGMPVMVWDVIPDGFIDSAGFRGHFIFKWREHSSSPF